MIRNMNEVHTLLDRKNTICSRKLVETSFYFFFKEGKDISDYLEDYQ